MSFNLGRVVESRGASSRNMVGWWFRPGLVRFAQSVPWGGLLLRLESEWIWWVLARRVDVKIGR